MHRPILALLTALSVSGLALAGPAGPGDVAGDAGVGDESGGAVQRAVPTGTGEGRDGARTVDLLIEMQGRSAGLTFNERTRPEAREGRAGGLPGTHPGGGPGGVTGGPSGLAAPSGDDARPPDTNRAGLFGSAAVPQTAARSAQLAEARSGAETVRASAIGSARADRTGDPADLYEKLWLPRMVIQWIRDNRVLVIGGAVLLLVAVWASSVAASRRR